MTEESESKENTTNGTNPYWKFRESIMRRCVHVNLVVRLIYSCC